MNHIAIVNKHLKGLESAFAAIGSTETLQKAREAVRQTNLKLGIEPRSEMSCLQAQSEGVAAVPTITFVVGRSDSVGGVSAPISSQNVCTATETGSDSLSSAFLNDGVVAEEPSDPKIEGDLPGCTGTFYYETVRTPESAAGDPEIELIGSWPASALITVIGLAPNRRSVKCRLPEPDGRIVSMERSGTWKAGDEVKVKLVRAGTYPLFRAEKVNLKVG